MGSEPRTTLSELTTFLLTSRVSQSWCLGLCPSHQILAAPLSVYVPHPLQLICDTVGFLRDRFVYTLGA